MRDLPNLKKQIRELFEVCLDKNLCFSMLRCTKEEKISLLEDSEFVLELDSIKATSASKDMRALDRIVDACLEDDPTVDAELSEEEIRYQQNMRLLKSSSTLFKAIEMRKEIMFEQMNRNKDEEKALNITFYALNKEDYEKSNNIEINKGDGAATKITEDDVKQGQREIISKQIKNAIKVADKECK